MYTTLHSLFQRTTWGGVWIAIRRSGRDAHARRLLLRFVFSFALIFAGFGVELYWFRGLIQEDPTFFRVLLIGTIIWIAFLICLTRYSSYRDRAKAEAETPSVATEIKLAIFREACLLAALLIRLASERAMEKEIPPEIEIITRRKVIDRLRSRGFLEDVTPAIRDLLLAPDGHWSGEQKVQTELFWECLAVLHHALGLSELSSVTEWQRYNTVIAHQILNVPRPERLKVTPSWDLRPERNAANEYFTGCWLELIARGEIEEPTPETIETALSFRADLQSQGYTSGFLVGAQMLSEVPTDLLRIAGVRAYRRFDTLRLLVDITCGDQPASELQTMFADCIAPTEEQAVIS